VQTANAVRLPEGSAKKEGVESLIWNAARQKLNRIILKLVAIIKISYNFRARTLLQRVQIRAYRAKLGKRAVST
jgi:hypothetical protein